MLDLTIVRLLGLRENYDKYLKAVPVKALDDLTQVLLTDYGRYFKQFPNVERVEVEPFRSWFRTFGHPKLKPEQFDKYDVVIKRICDPVPEAVAAGFTARLVEADAAMTLTALLERYNEGEEVDLGPSLRSLVDEFDAKTEAFVNTPLVDDDIDQLMEDQADGKGLSWRLECLNRVIRPAIEGDFIIVAARPDVGKTTFLASELTHMAPQMEDLWPGEGREILWFNNEGKGSRIKVRAYQAALGLKYSEMQEKSKARTLRPEYAKVMGGSEDVLKIFDVHDFYNWQIEDIIKRHKPGIIVFDMLDNVKFGGMANNNGTRTDQLLEAMYQWARVIGVKYDCVVICTSQISGDADGERYPGLGQLKDSKTGKQGAADLIITIGFQNDNPEVRYMGTTKNKLQVEGGKKTLREGVNFCGDIARFEDFQWVDEPSPGASGDPMEE